MQVLANHFADEFSLAEAGCEKALCDSGSGGGAGIAPAPSGGRFSTLKASRISEALSVVLEAIVYEAFTDQCGGAPRRLPPLQLPSSCLLCTTCMCCMHVWLLRGGAPVVCPQPRTRHRRSLCVLCLIQIAMCAVTCGEHRRQCPINRNADKRFHSGC